MRFIEKSTIYLAGGCFWGVEAYFKKLQGVIDTDTGYANGEGTDTDYKKIKQTHHAETVRIVYDKNRLDLAEILLHYFRIINPISVNKQGNDVGEQYRTGIFYEDEEDLEVINSVMKYIQSKYSKKGTTIIVEVEIKDKSLNLTVKNEIENNLNVDWKLVKNKFYRGDMSRNRIKNNGSGVGLTIVNDIVTHLNGEFDVCNKDNLVIANVIIPVY